MSMTNEQIAAIAFAPQGATQQSSTQSSTPKGAAPPAAGGSGAAAAGASDDGAADGGEGDAAEGEVAEGGEGAESDAETGSKGKLSWADAMKRVPPDVAKLMRQMQADYTRKTQEVAAQRKEMLREREALLRGYKPPEKKALPEYDPYSEESVAARIQAEVDRRLAEVLGPAREEFEVLQAEAQFAEFVTANPDFESDQELRAETQKILEADDRIDLETAYWAAKGRLAAARAKAAQAKAAATRAATTKAAQAPGVGRRAGAPAHPGAAALKSMDAAGILALAQQMAAVKKN